MSFPHSAAVLGLGRSGLAVARFLRAQGVSLTAYDQNIAARAHAERLNIPFYPLKEDTVPRGQVLFRSPGIRPDHPAILAACAAGARLSDDISLFAALCPCPILAVTGSDGKTTTATLIAEGLREGGLCAHLGGNIGRSLLDDLPHIRPEHLVVLELSSFQLMTASLRPACAAVTNLTPNHLNWHRDLREYTAAKRRLCTLAARCVLREGVFPEVSAARISATTRADFCLTDGMLCARGQPILALDEMRLLGLHNAENALTAMAVTEGLVPPTVFAPLLRRFTGVAHRMQWVARRLGVDCYDSSIDTTPDRTLTTLATFAARGLRPMLLLGGAEKGLPLSALIEALPTLTHSLFLFGKAERLAALLTERHIPYRRFDTLEEATAAALTGKGRADTLLLSPAFTSFDAYPDYVARGKAFLRAVQAVPETTNL